MLDRVARSGSADCVTHTRQRQRGDGEGDVENWQELETESEDEDEEEEEEWDTPLGPDMVLEERRETTHVRPQIFQGYSRVGI